MKNIIQYKTNKTIIAKNKQATFSYTLSTKFEAGMILLPWEVKSLRAGQANITAGYIQIKDGIVLLHNMDIPPLKNIDQYSIVEPHRIRTLLLKKREIKQLSIAVNKKGESIIPLLLYWSGNFVKLAIALGKGNKGYDKRQLEKKRDWLKHKPKIIKNN